MKLSKKGLIALASYEALILNLYLDSGGVKTIGIGSTSSDIKDLNSWGWDRSITIEQAVDIYQKSLVKYTAALDAALKVEVSQQLYDALVSITYNIGIGAMQKSTFMKRVNSRDTVKRITEAMSWFCKDNGREVKGLVNRRNKEAMLALNGDYGDGLVALVQVDKVTHKPIYKTAKKIDISQYIK